MAKKRPQKSYYYPKFPEKYKGNSNNIICRSSWERIACNYFDLNSNVKLWNSEEYSIWYKWPDGTSHRYFIDYWVEFYNGGTFLVEVKPLMETKPPTEIKTKSKKKLQTYINQLVTYQKNMAKWEAARAFCALRGWKFKILTEVELHIQR